MGNYYPAKSVRGVKSNERISRDSLYTDLVQVLNHYNYLSLESKFIVISIIRHKINESIISQVGVK